MTISYIEIRHYNDLSGANYVLLPNFSELTFDKKYNDIGAIDFKYPYEQARSIGISDQSLVGIVVGFSDGSAQEIERYLLNTTESEKASDSTKSLHVTGRSVFSVFDDAIVYPSNWPSTQPSGQEFVNNNPGTIWRTLILRAKNRGALSQVSETGFSGSADSNGQGWQIFLSQTYSTGTSYTQVFTDMMDRGICDARVVGWRLDVANGGSFGRHVDIGTLEVRPAKNTTEMVVSTDSSEACSTVLIEGDSGAAVERNSGNALGAVGRRRERYVSQGGIDDNGILSVLGDAELGIYGLIPQEETVGVTDFDALEVFKDFDVADWVWVRYDTDNPPEERRIRQIAVAVDENRALQVGLTLNSIIYDQQVRMQRRIDSYTGNGSTYGPPPSNEGDEVPPSAPATPSYSSDAYNGPDGGTYATINLDWPDVQFNSDGTVLEDLDGYEIWQKQSSESEPHFHMLAITGSSLWSGSGYPPGSNWDFKVRAVDTSGNKSAFCVPVSVLTATDATPPATPSSLSAVSNLGVIRLTWDGLTSTGGPMDVDFARLDVFISDDPTFSTGIGELVGSLYSAGTVVAAEYNGDFINYNQTYFFRADAVDRTGNASPYSAIVSASVTPIVDTDLIYATIDGANIEPGTITASDAIIANTITGGLIQAGAISSGQISANAITSGHIQAGAVTVGKLAAQSVTAANLAAGVLNFQTAYGMMLFSGKITTGDWWSGDGSSNYSQRLEIGRTGFSGNDDIDQIRMFNNNTVVSIRHRTGSPGCLFYSLFNSTYGTSVLASVEHSGADGWVLMGKGSKGLSGIKIKFTNSACAPRTFDDSTYADIACHTLLYQQAPSSFSYRAWKRDIAPVQADYLDVIRKNSLVTFKYTEEFQRGQGNNGPHRDVALYIDRDEELEDPVKAYDLATARQADSQKAWQDLLDRTHYGFIADDFPDWMQTEVGYDTAAVTGVLWEAVKELDRQIKELKGAQ